GAIFNSNSSISIVSVQITPKFSFIFVFPLFKNSPKNKTGCEKAECPLAARLTWSTNTSTCVVLWALVSKLCVAAFRRVCLCQQECSEGGMARSRVLGRLASCLWRPNQRDPL